MAHTTDGARVGVIMGSESDLPAMLPAIKILEELGIVWEVNALSAHRTPGDVAEYAGALAARGVQVVIAGAGGAAHLPGVIAAMTPLPVIGVPIKSTALDGLDSLLAIVQMPPGVPVATVGVNAAQNAGILAVQIIGAGDPEVRRRVQAFKDELASKVRRRNAGLPERVASEVNRGE